MSNITVRDFLRCRCLACQIEYHWKKLQAQKKRLAMRNAAIRQSEKELRREKAYIAYLEKSYQIAAEGAEHPERLAI